jgi:hypothetical protein
MLSIDIGREWNHGNNIGHNEKNGNGVDYHIHIAAKVSKVGSPQGRSMT